LLEKIRDLDLRVQTIEKQLTGYTWPLIGMCIAIIGLVLGYRFDHGQQGYAFDPEVFPVEAIDWLIENPQEGQMFNLFQWGGYLEYRLWPQEKVFIDSKSDFYGEDFVRQYMKVIQLEKGWESVINQYNVSWAILPKYERAVEGIQEELGWEIIYQDNMAVILKEP